MVSIGICDCSMNLSTFPPVSDESVSRPRMMPDTTSMPKPFNVSMEPSSGTIMLCSLEIDLSASGSGVSMPQKIVVNAASRIRSRISGRLAMLSVASHDNSSG